MSVDELIEWFETLPPGVESLVPNQSPSRTGVITNPVRFVAPSERTWVGVRQVSNHASRP